MKNFDDSRNTILSILFINILIVVPLFISAQPVNEKTAAQVATNFLSAKSGASKAPLKLVYTKSNEKSILYRVYSNANSFVIVTGDKRCKPILGYSTEGAFVLPDTREAYMSNYWSFMDARAEEINYAIQQDIIPPKSISKQWTDLSRKDYSSPIKGSLKLSVSALLSTTWNQNGSYNDSTPNSALAGCVPVAMAQVLKYHYQNEATATQGVGRYAYSTYHANFGNTNYNFHTMPNGYANSDVVQLLYHCGVACHAGWGATSNAETNVYGYDPIMNALVNYFGMAYSTIQHVKKSNYSDANWYSLIKSELNAGRPVLYRGSNGSGGHMWVCDGYDDSGGEYFHMNWGWGGSYNGNYLLTSYLQSYNLDQMAIIGIQRADLESVPSTITSNTTWTIDKTFTTSVAVADGVTLTIDPGVTVDFAQDCELRIFGTLDARGTSGNLITFTATNQSNGWEGLRWYDDSDYNDMDGKVMNDNDSSYLHYVRVEYSKSSGVEVSYFDRLELDSCYISNNEATNGGGFYLDNSSIYVSKCRIFSNDVGSGSGGGLYVTGQADPIVENTLIYANNASTGAGVEIQGYITMYNNKIINNTASSFGGGFEVASNNPKPFVGNVISNNVANLGAAFFIKANIDILNSTIATNKSNNNSTFCGFGSITLNLTNTIIYDNFNSNSVNFNFFSNVIVNCYNCLLDAGYSGSGTYTFGDTLMGNPLLMETLAQGYDANAVNANFGLDSASKCINSGTTSGITGLPTYDIIGNPRQNGIIDIGAYEFDLATYLPIELLSFQASKSGKNVLLSWTTASEINNNYFIVEHSTDAKHFTEIGSLPSQNSSSISLLNYEYTHLSPVDGINYYRLKQVDFDGKYTYSDVRAVAFGAQVESLVYPNPSDGRFTIELTNAKQSSHKLEVTNALGQVIHTAKVHVASTQHKETLDISALPQGIYYLTIQNEEGKLVTKLIRN